MEKKQSIIGFYVSLWKFTQLQLEQAKILIAILTGYQSAGATAANFWTFNVAVIIEEPLNVLDIRE